MLEGGDLLGAGARADAVRRRLHPGDEVTFVVDRNINYTDYCLSGCRFCAFYKQPGSGEGYLLSEAEIHRKIEETLALGGTAIMMQGGLHPDLEIGWYEQVFRGIKERYQVHIHSLSPPEVVHIAKRSSLTLDQTLRRLQTAGLDSLPGGGAEVLVDRVRTAISPHKIGTDTWLEVMRVAHGLGMKTTATMMFGSLDTPAERVEHLRRLRDLQDETGGFTAFIPWTFQPENTAMGKVMLVDRGGLKATVAEYLRTLSLSRLYLQNVPHVQSSFVTQGMKTCQVGLSMGADDFGSAMLEENVVSSAGCTHPTSIPEIERHIKDAGYVPQRRNMMYEPVETPATDRFGNPAGQKKAVVSKVEA